MVNLLSDKPPRRSFPRLDPEQFQRFRSRLERLVAVTAMPMRLTSLEREFANFEASLEELESAPSVVTALDLLVEFDRRRVAVASELDDRNIDPIGGELICYAPGRSLSTGEAELASRGYFDVLDRPPLANWLEVIARPSALSERAFEVGILVWVPESETSRALSGRKACGTGSLALLREVSTTLDEQLQPLLHDITSWR